MLYAIDRNYNEVYITQAVSRGDYYCRVCGKPVIPRKGEIRAWHFAHAPGSLCADSWNTSNSRESYDISDWHRKWQEQYPSSNREVVLSLNGIRHIADVLIDKTVIEFQNSPISSKHFSERTHFYRELGYKVIWLFNMTSDQYAYTIQNEKTSYSWVKPYSTFRDLTVIEDNVDVFFQFSSDGDIYKVTDVSSIGFELFTASGAYALEEFLCYTGLVNGSCLLPNLSSLNEIESTLKVFLNRYPIDLNEQQQRAVQATDGAILVLAVPGSGKTTVLTYRLGYLVLCKGVLPNSIMAITFTKAASAEMRKRLREYFGSDVEQIHISTLNSLSLEIVRNVDPNVSTAGDTETRAIIRAILKKHNIPLYSDYIRLYESAISFVKSKINREDAVKEVLANNNQLSSVFSEILEEYNQELRQNNKIDFNDQNNLALKYLQEHPDLLKKYQDQYRYFCVDEAQDTNQVQHEIIKLLASKTNNIFMVGDEDQSIYGFAGAYPEALLNFRDIYPNPFVIKLEKNYRSTRQIVKASKKFIDSNIKRNPKQMDSVRGDGSEVKTVIVNSLSEEISASITAAEQYGNRLALLYRENSSALPLIVALEKKNISYQLIADRTEYNFIGSSNAKRVISFLRLVVNPKDERSIWDLQYRIYHNLYSRIIYDAIGLVRQNEEESIILALEKIVTSPVVLDNISVLKELLSKAKNSSIKDAISIACNYCISYDFQRSKIFEIYTSIIDENSTIQDFLDTIDSAQNHISSVHNDSGGVYLSTFHSAKGLEFDKVYIIDAYDGICPNTTAEYRQLYEEERRLFYVAMTRAQNELLLFKRKDKTTSFVDEINAINDYTVKDNKPENTDPLFKGMTLYQLWKPYYSTIIVSNLEDGQDMIIHGYDGKMRTRYGKIAGQYTRWTYKGYSYSKEYAINSANRPIWLRKRATVDQSFSPINNCLSINEILTTNSSNLIVECAPTGIHYLLEFTNPENLDDYSASRIIIETGETTPATFEVKEAEKLIIWRVVN